MGFDKNKSMRNAERFLMHGKINAAIIEYREIVQNTPDDVNSQNMLGDLYLKASDERSAIECFTKVAEHYNETGFVKKAIAVYNKIHKLYPESSQVSLTLGDLYQSQGAYAEACRHLEIVGTQLENDGDIEEALKIWQRIAEISKRNWSVLIKIGEYFVQQNENSKAAQAFVEAGNRLALSEKHHDSAAAFSRVLEMEPHNLAAIRGYVKEQVSLGYPEEAVHMLDQYFKQDSQNEEIRNMLIDCYLDIDQPIEAREALKSILSSEPKAVYKFIDVVDYHLRKNQLDEAVEILQSISEQIMVSNEPERLVERATEIVTRNPEHIGALRLLVKYYGWHKNEKELKTNLEQLRHAAHLNAMDDDERYAISQLLLLSPQSEDLIKRLKELGGGSAGNRAIFDQAEEYVPVHEEESESDVEFSKSAEESGSTNVPTFESFDNLLQGVSGDGAFVGGSEADYREGIATESYPPIPLTDADVHTESLEKDETIEDDEAEADAENGASDEPAEVQTFELETSSGDSLGSDSDEEGSAISEVAAPNEEQIAEQIENIKFYIEQGYVQVALHTISELDEIHGRFPGIDSLREELKNSGAFEEYSAENRLSESTRLDSTGTEEKVPLSENKDSEVVKSESEIESNQEFVESELNPQDSENAISEVQTVSENLVISDEIDDERENDEISREIGEDELENIPAQKEESETLEDLENQDLVKSDESLTDVDESKIRDDEGIGEGSKLAEANEEPEAFAEDEEELVIPEKSGEESLEAYADEQYDTHYHHAVAYQEMGLHEDAVREFRYAISAISPQDKSGRYFQCCTLLGHCYLQINSPKDSITWFEKASAIENLTDIEQMAIRYELATAYELDGDFAPALENFEIVANIDSGFRDVAERIEVCKKNTIPVTA